MHYGFGSSRSELLEGGRFAPLKVVETWFLVQRVSDLITFLRSRTSHGDEPFYSFFGDVISEKTDALGVGFDLTFAWLEIDVQAQLPESKLSRQKRID